MYNYFVVVFVYDWFCMFEFGCVVELFVFECFEFGVDWYCFVVCVSELGLVCVVGGIIVVVFYWFVMFDCVDIIVIFGWCDLDELLFELLLKKLWVVYWCGVWFCLICLGVFVFVVVGVFDGFIVMIYWWYVECL